MSGMLARSIICRAVNTMSPSEWEEVRSGQQYNSSLRRGAADFTWLEGLHLQNVNKERRNRTSE